MILNNWHNWHSCLGLESQMLGVQITCCFFLCTYNSFRFHFKNWKKSRVYKCLRRFKEVYFKIDVNIESFTPGINTYLLPPRNNYSLYQNFSPCASEFCIFHPQNKVKMYLYQQKRKSFILVWKVGWMVDGVVGWVYTVAFKRRPRDHSPPFKCKKRSFSWKKSGFLEK